MSTLKMEKEIDQRLIEYIQENQNSFYRLAYSYVKNREEALDVVQNAVYNSLKSVHSLKDAEYMKTWFYRILINASLSSLRSNKRVIPTDPVDMPEEIIHESAERAELMDLYLAVDQLDPTCKAIITLRYFEDMKISDVAETLGENINSVKAKLYKTLKQLRINLESEVFKS